ncbi:DUF6069 family protein [Streptomyces endocoffeicus]|uniref:DUF6069 family protein n=1 Tax=Streptomyces endocoffeicus TaxID=2898945 RepID=UPI001E6286EE|nr:DUF6069 family protein [Streptomyces endocoffeicus]
MCPDLPRSRLTPGRLRPAITRCGCQGLVLAAGGAVAATVVAAAADAAGVSLEIAGERIPLLGFTQLAFVFSVVGVALAAAFRRWSGRPARVFVRTAVALVAVSFLPGLLTPDAGAATRVTLIATHIAVAAILIPGAPLPPAIAAAHISDGAAAVASTGAAARCTVPARQFFLFDWMVE